MEIGHTQRTLMKPEITQGIRAIVVVYYPVLTVPFFRRLT
jgi:hypothetical protein